MMNIQNEVQKIHNQYGMSEKANYKIQLLCEQYAKEYHESEVKKLNILAVSSLVCPKCKSDAIAEYPDYKECRICGNVWQGKLATNCCKYKTFIKQNLN